MEQHSYKNERSEKISKLLNSQKSRVAYIKGKLSVLVPTQIRQLRMKSTNPPMPKQGDLGMECELHQSRISMFETPGGANLTIDTLSRVAAGLRCGLVIEFVPFSKMLRWENSFRPDSFNVTRLNEDEAFLNPASDIKANAMDGSFYCDNDDSGADIPLPIDGQGYKKPANNEQGGFPVAQGA